MFMRVNAQWSDSANFVDATFLFWMNIRSFFETFLNKTIYASPVCFRNSFRENNAHKDHWLEKKVTQPKMQTSKRRIIEIMT